MTASPATLTVSRLGAAGDGLALWPDGAAAFLPLTLPGEVVRCRPAARNGEGQRGELLELLSPSAERIAPPCPHFGDCGGCVLQHWAAAPLAAWKRARVAEALTRAGFSGFALAETLSSPPRSRRRADLAIRRDGRRLLLGLHARGEATRVVDLDTCLVLAPPLLALLPPLRALLLGLAALRREGAAVLTLLDSGPDLLLRTDGELSAGDRTALARFGTAQGVPRIAWALRDAPPEMAAQAGAVRHMLSGVALSPPPGAFLQPTREGEAAIIAAVLAALPEKLAGRRRVLDLYAGLGTLSLPLAARARIAAFEGDAAAIAALQATGRVTATRRDLARQPLLPAELKDVAAVVLDPPFAGAPEQLAQLARAAVPHIIYVSCNPAALARDTRLLAQAGYRVTAATPIDQFPWSAHVEAVVGFARG